MIFYLKIISTAPYPYGRIMEVDCVASDIELDEDWCAIKTGDRDDPIRSTRSFIYINYARATMAQRSFHAHLYIGEEGVNEISNVWMEERLDEEMVEICRYSGATLFDVDFQLWSFILACSETRNPHLFIQPNSMQYFQKFLPLTFRNHFY